MILFMCLPFINDKHEKQTMEREFENLLLIKDNYPKFVITLDDYSSGSYEGIIHQPLRKFLSEFV